MRSCLAVVVLAQFVVLQFLCCADACGRHADSLPERVAPLHSQHAGCSHGGHDHAEPVSDAPADGHHDHHLCVASHLVFTLPKAGVDSTSSPDQMTRLIDADPLSQVPGTCSLLILADAPSRPVLATRRRALLRVWTL